MRVRECAHLTENRCGILLVRDRLDRLQDAVIKQVPTKRCPFALIKTPKLLIAVVHQMLSAHEMLIQDELQHVLGIVSVTIKRLSSRICRDAVGDFLDLAPVERWFASRLVFGQKRREERI